MLFRGEFNYFKKSACGNFMPLALLAVLSTLFCENTLSASLKPQAHRDAKYSDQINKTFSMSQEDDSFDSDEEENQIDDNL